MTCAKQDIGTTDQSLRTEKDLVEEDQDAVNVTPDSAPSGGGVVPCKP